MPAHHRRIALDVIETRHARKQSPFFESDLLKQSQARFVVRENQSNHGVDAECRCPVDCFGKLCATNSASPESFVDVDTDFGGVAIGTGAAEMISAFNQPTTL